MAETGSITVPIRVKCVGFTRAKWQLTLCKWLGIDAVPVAFQTSKLDKEFFRSLVSGNWTVKSIQQGEVELPGHGAWKEFAPDGTLTVTLVEA